jgi:hypothetical protein
MDRLEEAENALHAAIAGAAFNPDTAYYLANVDLARNREAEARALLKSAIEEPGPFAMRQEAKALLNQLNKTQLNKAQPAGEPAAKAPPGKGPLSKEPAMKEPPAAEQPAKK